MESIDTLQISDEKRNFIVNDLNPVLDEMVAECIHRMPDDPVHFMLDWLEMKQVADQDKLLDPEEKERLNQENQALAKDVSKVKCQMQEAVKLCADGDEEQAVFKEEEEEEEDDEDSEPPPGFDSGPPKGARASVSAEAYGEWNAKKAFVPPVIPKSDAQKDRLKSVLGGSFLFSSLEDNDFGIVIGAMKEVLAEVGKRVINQGESGDFLFVIEQGKLDCIIKLPDGSEKVVKTCESGDVFGELALLYNCPRAASVQAAEACVLWQLDRDTFNAIVKEAAQKKRARYDAFLSKVPLLQSMDAYERSQLADALKIESFADGATIVTQGDVGSVFYILEEGEVVAKKGDQVVMQYAVGDYFGELALIRNQPRACTVVAKGAARLLSVDSKSFKRLLNVHELLDKSTKYA